MRSTTQWRDTVAPGTKFEPEGVHCLCIALAISWPFLTRCMHACPVGAPSLTPAPPVHHMRRCHMRCRMRCSGPLPPVHLICLPMGQPRAGRPQHEGDPKPQCVEHLRFVSLPSCLNRPGLHLSTWCGFIACTSHTFQPLATCRKAYTSSFCGFLGWHRERANWLQLVGILAIQQLRTSAVPPQLPQTHMPNH